MKDDGDNEEGEKGQNYEDIKLRGNEYYKGGDYKKAIALYMEALAICDNNEIKV